MRSGKSALMREYRKELRKVMNRIMKLQSEGYIIHERNIPKEKSEKNITRRDIERLKKYKESYIKNLRSTKFRTREGKLISGARGEEIQRSEAAKKGWRERRWRDEINRQGMINTGDAIIEAIRMEINEGLTQIPIIKNDEQKQGYWQRCIMIRGTLDAEEASDPEGLRIRLARVNSTIAVQHTQIACRYDVGASESEAWSAALELMVLLRGSRFSVQELQSMEEGDYGEWFEEY